MALTAWDEQEQFRDRASAIANAGARNGRSLHRVLSKGAGQTRIAQPIAFRLTFIGQPTFTSGVTLAAGQLQDGAYPVVSIGVFRWQKDGRGFYIGAWLWVAVTYGPTELSSAQDYQMLQAQQAAEVGADYQQSAAYLSAQTELQRAIALNRLELEHHLCFEGLALRDVNYDEIMANG